MRELMVYRHLYAHRSGVVDEQFIRDHRSITATDLTPEFAKLGYPDQDVYWFEPLHQLNDLITTARRFFRNLPA